MNLPAIISIGELLWDIYKEITKETIKAENNSSLDTGYKKHKHVHQVICQIIDGKKLCYEEKEGLKEKMNPIISDQVKVMHESMMFAKRE